MNLHIHHEFEATLLKILEFFLLLLLTCYHYHHHQIYNFKEIHSLAHIFDFPCLCNILTMLNHPTTPNPSFNKSSLSQSLLMFLEKLLNFVMTNSITKDSLPHVLHNTPTKLHLCMDFDPTWDHGTNTWLGCPSSCHYNSSWKKIVYYKHKLCILPSHACKLFGLHALNF